MVFETKAEALCQVTRGTERTRLVMGEGAQFPGVLVAGLAAALMEGGVWAANGTRRRKGKPRGGRICRWERHLIPYDAVPFFAPAIKKMRQGKDIISEIQL